MNLQTAWIRKDAKKHYGAYKDDAGWHGFEEVNHPTPSGSERWLTTLSDNRSFPDEQTAITEFKKSIIELDEAFKKAKKEGKLPNKLWEDAI